MDATFNLADIRREIDALDADLRALLLKRADLVAQVAASKAQNGGGPVLRPAREAEQMARLSAWQAAEAPHLNLAGLIAIWREIIGLAIAQQGGLHIFVTPASESAARIYFGSSLNYELCDSAEAALAKHAAQPDAVVVLGVDETSAGLDGLEAFVRLPVGTPPGAAQAICYGQFGADEGSAQ